MNSRGAGDKRKLGVALYALPVAVEAQGRVKIIEFIHGAERALIISSSLSLFPSLLEVHTQL